MDQETLDSGQSRGSDSWQEATSAPPSDWMDQSRRQSVLIAMLMPIAVWAFSRISPGWAMASVIVFLAALAFIYLRPGLTRTGFIGLATFVLTVGAVMPYFIGHDCKATEAELKQNLHGIQLAVERYSIDHDGEYLSDITDVIGEGRYMDAFPANPYLKKGLEDARVNTRSPEWESMLQMQHVSLRSTNTPGSFAYIPITNIDETGSEKVVGYDLLAFGDRAYNRYDLEPVPEVPLAVDCIVILLSSTNTSHNKRGLDEIRHLEKELDEIRQLRKDQQKKLVERIRGDFGGP